MTDARDAEAAARTRLIYDGEAGASKRLMERNADAYLAAIEKRVREEFRTSRDEAYDQGHSEGRALGLVEARAARDAEVRLLRGAMEQIVGLGDPSQETYWPDAGDRAEAMWEIAELTLTDISEVTSAEP